MIRPVGGTGDYSRIPNHEPVNRTTKQCLEALRNFGGWKNIFAKLNPWSSRQTVKQDRANIQDNIKGKIAYVDSVNKGDIGFADNLDEAIEKLGELEILVQNDAIGAIAASYIKPREASEVEKIQLTSYKNILTSKVDSHIEKMIKGYAPQITTSNYEDAKKFVLYGQKRDLDTRALEKEIATFEELNRLLALADQGNSNLTHLLDSATKLAPSSPQTLRIGELLQAERASKIPDSSLLGSIQTGEVGMHIYSHAIQIGKMIGSGVLESTDGNLKCLVANLLFEAFKGPLAKSVYADKTAMELSADPFLYLECVIAELSRKAVAISPQAALPTHMLTACTLMLQNMERADKRKALSDAYSDSEGELPQSPRPVASERMQVLQSLQYIFANKSHS